ncbi:U-box domain-containing protein 33-like isoform X1 [Phoenix dactylifera]|uniref:RING-type E3 ubiquitin transferase n=2 Tax=Phoenix dactylifera TaxID=42345 RepID=A0A8B7BJW7_PHODC|nr:U-box domain-containing protein 33-like isoform X1 [Phoenix dactylifera]
MERRGYGSPASVRSSGSARSGLTEIEEEPAVAEEAAEDVKVYVALGKEVKEGKANLLWVLEKTSWEKKIVILHVHRPAQKIPMMGAWFPVNQLKEREVEAYWQLEREKMNKSLDEYLDICACFKVQAEKLVFETDDVSKGLVELIAQHGITKLVMGAAADKHYSRKMKELRSKTALSVQQQADPSCKIWFVCRGNLIYMRDADQDGSGMVQSPTASSSSMSSQSEQLRSESLPQGQSELWNLLANPRHEDFRHRSRSVDFNSHGGAMSTALPHEGLTSPGSSKPSVTDPWEGITRSLQCSDRSLCSVSEEGLSSVGLTPALKDEGREEGSLSLPSVYESEDLQFSSLHHGLDDVGTHDEAYEKLQLALMEAENLKCEAYEEYWKRQKAERDLFEATRRVKAAENLYTKEMKERKKIEETLARERMELEKLKKQRDDIFEELKKACEKRVALEIQITDSDCTVKNFEEKLSETHDLLNLLRLEHEKLRSERDNTVREVETQHQTKAEMTSSTHGTTNFSEFSYAELKQATLDFDDSLKIGEGGYGSVYKGFLRHTTVAIKMLNPQSMQGQSEFHQEVAVLGRVRHPNLVTLIGACPEAGALIYEFLPNGSLEDRLICRDNTPALSWQIRTRITAEICSALIFLHSNKPRGVVHGDLKPANILLDANFTSKLGDFGICRFLVQSNTSTTLYCHTHPKGTFAYMDPEFLTSGELTPHSDVYSFGVIILRLLTGRPALGVINKVREALGKGCLDEILDASAGGWPYAQAKQLAHLGLKCCEAKRKRRPDLTGEAWKVLEPMMKAVSSKGLSCLSLRSALEDNNCIPSFFICPISQEILKDPHVAADGFSYEAEAIKGWLDSGHETSPMTNLKLPHRGLVPNRALRSVIQQWLQQ